MTLAAEALPANLEPIHQGRRHTTYRGLGRDRPLVVKMTAVEGLDAGAIASLRHEYELLRDLSLRGVVQAVALVRAGERLGLVMEDAGSENLATRLKGGALTIAAFLEVAVPLAEAVARLHEHRIVHRNLNPSNIVCDPASLRATIVDFGIATSLSALTVESASPALLEGTLGYLSPEQTGRTGRAMDSRTDLYSLGATFYEMLVGLPPFTGADAVELVHAHLARRPRQPHDLNVKIPPALSQVVLKLLEKEPEHRYQTAEALVTDLREAADQWNKNAGIVPFQLARHDVPRELGMADKLYGRADEVHALGEAFTHACEGRKGLVLVMGPPGIGKSALIKSLEGSVIEQRGLFIAGKFDQLQRRVPFSGLTQAFRALVRQLLMEPESVLAAWRERLQEAVAPNGQDLVDVVPELGRILGPQPPMAQLGPVESRNRFRLVFTAFLRVFARFDHPFVLFLDDLQWVDAASLQLLEQWMDDAETQHFLLVGACRDEEVGPDHPLTRSLVEMRAAGATIQEMRLAPIGADDVAHLIGDSLKQDVTHVRPLSDVVAKKTAGNPFFVRQLLHALHAQNLIRFSTQSRIWEWELSEIEHAPMSGNVLELMVRAIENLPQDTRKLMEAAACIGHRFDLVTLAEVTGRSSTDATRQLWPALEGGLLVPLGDTYRAPRLDGPMDENLGTLRGMMQFMHDRVQQAAYSCLTEERRCALHLDIGRRLLRGASLDQRNKRLFDIVDQLNFGEALVSDAAEQRQLVELNLAAGSKAKASAAYQAALNYLNVGLRVLQGRKLDENGELSCALYRELAECAYLTGQHAKAEELVALVMRHASSNEVKAELCCLRVLAATDAGDYARALECGREGLALFELEWPRERLPDAIEVEAATIMHNVGARVLDTFAQAPEVNDEDTRVCMRLLSLLGAPAYFSFDANVLQFVMMRLVNLSLLRGPSAYSSYGYTFYGALHNSRTGDYETGHDFGRLGLAVAQRFGNRAEESRTLQVFGLIVNSWKAPLRTNVPLFEEGYRAGVESGELQYAAYNLVALLINGFPLGTPLREFMQDVAASFEFSTKHKNKTMLEFTLAFRQGARYLTGQTRTRTTFDDDEFEEHRYVEDAKDNQTVLAFYWPIRLQVAYLFERYEEARTCSELAKKMLPSALGMIIEAEYVFYTALNLAAVYDSAPVEDRGALMTELENLRGKLAIWATH